MYQASEEFNNVILGNKRAFQAKIKIGNTEIASGIRSIKQYTRSCSNDCISIGGAVSSYIEIEMWKPDIQLENKEMEVSIGLTVEGSVIWTPLGLYTVQHPQNDEGFIKFIAYDRIQSKLSGAYFSTLLYPADGKTVLQEISSKTGVPINASNLPDGIMIQKRAVVSENTFDNNGNVINSTTYENPFNGYTYREALGYIAMLYCKFATMDRSGTVVFRWYIDTDYTIGTDRYYDDLISTELVFSVQSITCQAGENAYTSGAGTATIQLENPVMTQARLDAVYLQVKGMQFLPISLSFYGDVRLDVGDIVIVNDKAGNIIRVPVMSIVQEYDGGVLTKIQSFGGMQDGSSVKGPTLQRLDRTYMELFLVKELVGNKASFNYVYSIDADFKNVKADYGEYKTLVANNFVAANGQIANLSGEFASFKSGEFADLQAKQADFETTTTNKFTAVNGNIETLTGDFADYKTIVAQKFTAVNGQITNISGEFSSYKTQVAENFTATNAEIENLKTKNLSLEVLIADKVDTKDLTAINAEITNLTGQFSSFQTSMVQELIAAKGWMAEGSIGDAQISNVSANKLKAGTIDTALITISGSDGRLQILDNTIQISDASRTRVQIGKDASGDYTLAVWDAAGNLIWDALGATEHTIQRKIIRDKMVADDAAIQALKIDFQSFDTALTKQGVSISGTVVQVGGKTLNVALSEQTQAITEHSETLTEHAAKIAANENAIKLKVSTSDFSTYKTTVTGQINNAKAAAISTAAEDATTKANSALADAKTYTNAQITTVNSHLTTIDSSIDVLQDQIALKVEQVDIDTAIQNLDIDGRNLLSDTRNFGMANTTGVCLKVYNVALNNEVYELCAVRYYSKTIGSTNESVLVY